MINTLFQILHLEFECQVHCSEEKNNNILISRQMETRSKLVWNILGCFDKTFLFVCSIDHFV